MRSPPPQNGISSSSLLIYRIRSPSILQCAVVTDDHFVLFSPDITSESDLTKLFLGSERLCQLLRSRRSPVGCPCLPDECLPRPPRGCDCCHRAGRESAP